MASDLKKKTAEVARKYAGDPTDEDRKRWEEYKKRTGGIQIVDAPKSAPAKKRGGGAPFGFHLNKGVDPNAAWSVSGRPSRDKETGLPTIIKEELDDDAAVRRNVKKQDADIDRREASARGDQEFAAQKQQRDIPAVDWQSQTKRSTTRTLGTPLPEFGVLDSEIDISEHFMNMSERDLWRLLQKDFTEKSGRTDE